MAYGNAEIYDRNESEAEREQKLLNKLKRISARGNNAEVKARSRWKLDCI